MYKNQINSKITTMDTQTAIQTLQGIKAIMLDDVTGSKAKLEAIDVALSQLLDTLNTPSQDLIQAQNAFLDAKNAQIIAEAEINTLEAELADAKVMIEELKAQLHGDTPTAPPELIA